MANTQVLLSGRSDKCYNCQAFSTEGDMFSIAQEEGGFSVWNDANLQYSIGPDIDGWRATFYYADFISDDGYVAGHGLEMEDKGGWWGWTQSDPIAFTVNLAGEFGMLGAGTPAWMAGNWACIDSYQPYMLNAATGDYKEVDGCFNAPATVSEPSVTLCLLGSALLLLLRRRGWRLYRSGSTAARLAA